MAVGWEVIVSFSELTYAYGCPETSGLGKLTPAQLNCYLGAKVDTKVTKARRDDVDQLN